MARARIRTPPDPRPVLDVRLDGDETFLVTTADEVLRHPSPELGALVGTRTQAAFRAFWVPPHGFERRWAMPIDAGTVLRRIIDTGWPVTPELGTLLELAVTCARVAHGGDVIPGLVSAATSGWIAAPGRALAEARRAALDDALRHHADAERLATLLVDAYATAVLGPVPDGLLGRTPTPTFTRWADRVCARRATGARLVLRLDTDAPTRDGAGFVLVPCVQGRRSSSVVAPVDSRDSTSLDDAAPALAVPADAIDDLVLTEWPAVTAAWSLLRGLPLAPVELELDDVVELVEHAGPRLEAAGIDVLLPAGFARRRKARKQLRVEGRPAGLDSASLLLTGAVRIDGQELTDAELHALLRAHHDLVSVGGSWTYLAAGERARIAAFVRRLGDADASTVLDVASEAASDDDTEITVDLDPRSWLARALAGTWHPTRAEHVAEPKLVRIPLRHYQRAGLDWMVWLERNEIGGILADDMGLGKTAMLLALVAHDHAEPTLVVAPTSVVGNWEREAARFTPGLRTAVFHGTDREDPSTIDADLVITSYGMLRRDPRLAAVAWHRVVLDEAQAIKNPQTATARAARALTTTHRIAATGTPVENDLDELWSLMAFASPGLLGARKAFADRYRMSGAGEEDGARLAHLRARIAAFILRRTKLDPGIVDELPERVVVRDDCLLTREQVALYEATATSMLGALDDISNAGARRLHVFAGITKLKQICNHPASLIESDTSELGGRSGKVDRLVELTREIAAEGEAVVVFTQYATFLRRLAAHLAEQVGLPVPILHGGVSRKRRDAIVERFGAETGPGVLAVSLRAGGTGLNLVRANHVIHFDRWWNPAVEDQASDRVWRIGQTRGVVVHTLVCPGTIEERIAELIERKRALAGAVITSTDQAITELTGGELAAFVALDADRATAR
ncbi:MAG: DEAD/DEAH box helicase [Acidimicrobiia bacterium]